MNEQRLVPWVLAAVVSAGCGPEQRDSASSEFTTGGSTSSTAESGIDGGVETGSTSSTESGVESSSGSDSGGAESCDGWGPPLPPYPWSLQDCLTEPCPEGEVCRYDPHEQCGAHPVCVDPATLACNCELYPDSGGLACPCPDYEGPVNELNQVHLECNTFMSPGPVTSNAYAHCII